MVAEFLREDRLPDYLDDTSVTDLDYVGGTVGDGDGTSITDYIVHTALDLGADLGEGARRLLATTVGRCRHYRFAETLA